MGSPPGSVLSVGSSITTSQIFCSMWISTLLESSIFVIIAKEFSNPKEVSMFMSLQSTGMSIREQKPMYYNLASKIEISFTHFNLCFILSSYI